MPDSTAFRLVLDTNTVMALWFFEDPKLVRLRRAIENHALLLVARADALEELRRVLAYRQFGASPERQRDILAGYAGRITATVDAAGDGTSGDAVAGLPVCRDCDDQKFLEIARDGRATHLISRDKALLRLNRHRLLRELFTVVTPEAFVATLGDD